MFVSLPQFLHANYYEKMVNGLNPDLSKHDTYIDVEKVSYVNIQYLYSTYVYMYVIQQTMISFV